MATRKIVDCIESMEYVQKRISLTSNLEQLQFSLPSAYFENWESLDIILEKCNNYEAAAIYQQYNELYLWHMYPCKVLAPQVMIDFESNGLPIIYYPRFLPLVDESEVWKHSDEQLYILLGRKTLELNISQEQLFIFLKDARDFCEDHALCEDDIFLNPSNIGWHPLFGLRIIDYGLTSTNKIF